MSVITSQNTFSLSLRMQKLKQDILLLIAKGRMKILEIQGK